MPEVLKLTPGRSKILVVLACGASILAALAMYYAQLPVYLLCLFLLVDLLLLLHTLYADVSDYCLVWNLEKANIRLLTGNQVYPIKKITTVYHMPGWVAFSLCGEDGFSKRIVLFKDALPDLQYRRLRVALRYALVAPTTRS